MCHKTKLILLYYNTFWKLFTSITFNLLSCIFFFFLRVHWNLQSLRKSRLPVFLPDLKYTSLSFIIHWPETISLWTFLLLRQVFVSSLSCFPLPWGGVISGTFQSSEKNFHSLLPSQIMPRPQSYWEPIVFRLLLKKKIVCIFLWFWFF